MLDFELLMLDLKILVLDLEVFFVESWSFSVGSWGFFAERDIIHNNTDFIYNLIIYITQIVKLLMKYFLYVPHISKNRNKFIYMQATYWNMKELKNYLMKKLSTSWPLYIYIYIYDSDLNCNDTYNSSFLPNKSVHQTFQCGRFKNIK